MARACSRLALGSYPVLHPGMHDTRGRLLGKDNCPGGRRDDKGSSGRSWPLVEVGKVGADNGHGMVHLHLLGVKRARPRLEHGKVDGQEVGICTQGHAVGGALASRVAGVGQAGDWVSGLVNVPAERGDAVLEGCGRGGGRGSSALAGSGTCAGED